jgi:outer membrane protein OmpA-like peptidoglycan-associated protein
LKLAGVALAFAPAAAADTMNETREPLTEVFFRFDSAELSPQAIEGLDQAVEKVNESLTGKLIMEGHADPRGNADYNVGLSIRRTEAVRKHLLARGLDPDMIVIASYGEDGPRRATFAQDRRVGLALTSDPLYVIINKALPVATAVTWNKPATTAEIDGPMREEPIDQVAGRR